MTKPKPDRLAAALDHINATTQVGSKSARERIYAVLTPDERATFDAMLADRSIPARRIERALAQLDIKLSASTITGWRDKARE